MLKLNLKEWEERLNNYEDENLFGARDDLEGYLGSCKIDNNINEYERVNKYLSIIWVTLRKRNLV